LTLAAPAAANQALAGGAVASVSSPNAAVAPPGLREVGFDQKLGDRVPQDITLAAEDGSPVRFAELLRGRPVVLALVYYECPMLCTMVLNGVVSGLKPLAFTAGKEFDVVVVSFDANEKPPLARAKKAAYLERYDRLGTADGWRFLTGDQGAIDRLTTAVGFRYAWDEPTKQFAHPSGVVVLTPDGTISRYLFGIDYAPRDIRLALVEAAAGTIGGVTDQILLYCYRYDPARGRYSAAVMNLVRGGAILTLVLMGTFIAVARVRERRRAG
jgi:protein SCO1/2